MFFMSLLVAKLTVIHFCDSCINISWDQWEAEVVALYPKWVAGTLNIRDLLSCHNEHRILITRIYNLTLFAINGNQWSIIQEVRINALLHVATLTIFLSILGSELKSGYRWILAGFGVIAFSIPYAYENTLCGFQSQFYFLLLDGILVLAAASFLKGWPCIVSVAVLSLLAPFTMASGPLAILPVVVVMGIKVFRNRQENQPVSKEVILIGLLLAEVAIAILLTPKVAAHQQFKAHDLAQSFKAMVQISAWPFPSHLLFALLLQAPLVGYMINFVRRIRSANPWEYFLFAIILWLWLQFASLAAGRALLVWSPRYMDIYVLSSILGVTVLLILLNFTDKAKKKTLVIIPALWISILAVGFLCKTISVRDQLRFIAKLTEIQKKNLALYLQGDEAGLNVEPVLYRPYPDPARLKWILSQEENRRIAEPVFKELQIDARQ